MKSYSEISTRYMKENKKRTILTIAGIALATILIFAIGTFLLSFKDSMIADARAESDYEFRINNLTSEEVDKLINNIEVKNYSIDEESNSIYNIKGTERQTYIYNGDEGIYKRILREELVEGRNPSKENEIRIDTYVQKFLNVSVGDKITLESNDDLYKEKTYTVVGIKKSTGGYTTNSPLQLEGYFDSSKLDDEKSYSVWVNLKSEKNKQAIISKVLNNCGIEMNEERKSDNSILLYLTGNGGNNYTDKALQNMAIFVGIIIVICTITVVYNSFNISVIERIRYFGILKSIGATSKQLRRIIFKEGYLMGLIALPIGCFIGFFALKYGIKIFIGDTLMLIENFKISFYPSIILLTAAVIGITIFLSLLGPVRKVNKLSAVDAMRNKNEIKIGKIKRRKSRIIGKIFGVEGSIAYKNIRRTPFRFIITVIALTISIILFNVFYGFMDFTKQTVSQQFMYVPFDGQLSKNVMTESFSSDEVKEIESLPFITDINAYYSREAILKIPVSSIDNEYEEKINGMSVVTYNGTNANVFVSTYVGRGIKELAICKDYIVEGSLNEEALNNGGVILVDGTVIRNGKGDKEIIRLTNYKVGDKIKVQRPDSNSENPSDDEFYEATVVGIANKDPFMGMYLGNGIELIYTQEGYKKLIGEVEYNGFLFNYGDNEDNRIKALEYFDSIKDTTNYAYSDIDDQLKEIDDIYAQVEFFVYCFIIVITIISIVNIFNTISTNLLLRKKEFSTLKAIGMTEKQLKKSVILEGTLYGIISSIIGGIISALLLALMVKAGAGMADVQYKFNLIAFIASIVCAIAVTYLSTLVPLKRINKLTIVEGISDEE